MKVYSHVLCIAGPIADQVYEEVDSPTRQYSRDVNTHYTGVPQSTSTTDVNFCGNDQSQDPEDRSVIGQASFPTKTVHSQTLVPTAVMDELKATITPDVISIPMTAKKSPLSISVYRKQMMNKTSSFSDDNVCTTLPAQRSAEVQNKKFDNVLQQTLLYKHT